MRESKRKSSSSTSSTKSTKETSASSSQKPSLPRNLELVETNWEKCEIKQNHQQSPLSPKTPSKELAAEKPLDKWKRTTRRLTIYASLRTRTTHQPDWVLNLNFLLRICHFKTWLLDPGSGRAGKILTSVLVVFIITWLPYNTLVIINVVMGKKDGVPSILWKISYYLWHGSFFFILHQA